MSNLLNINADEILTLFRKHFPGLPDDMEESVSAILTTEPPPEVNAEITLSRQEQDLIHCQIIEGENNTCTGRAEPGIFPLHLASTGTISSAGYAALFAETRRFYLAANLVLTGILFYDESQQKLLGIYTGSAIASEDNVSLTLNGGWASQKAA